MIGKIASGMSRYGEKIHPINRVKIIQTAIGAKLTTAAIPIMRSCSRSFGHCMRLRRMALQTMINTSDKPTNKYSSAQAAAYARGLAKSYSLVMANSASARPITVLTMPRYGRFWMAVSSRGKYSDRLTIDAPTIATAMVQRGGSTCVVYRSKIRPIASATETANCANARPEAWLRRMANTHTPEPR